MLKHFTIKALIINSLFSFSVKANFCDLKIYTNTTKFDSWVLQKDYWDGQLNGEYNVALNLIKNGDVFFDVGANFGTYLNLISPKKKNLTMYAFEPVPIIYSFLKKSVVEQNPKHYKEILKDWKTFLKQYSPNTINQINSKPLPAKQIATQNQNIIHLNNLALSSLRGKEQFYFKINFPSVGGLDAKGTARLPGTNIKHKMPIILETLDFFCDQNQISKINYLKIDTEGHDYNVLVGAHNLLETHKVDFIQFEYMDRCKNSNWNLEHAYHYLEKFDYTLFKIVSDGLVLIDEWRPSLENYIYANFLAVAPHIMKNTKAPNS